MGESLRVDEDDHPRTPADHLDAARRRPWLVHGGLPAGEAGRAGVPAVRDRAAERVVQPGDRGHPRHPRRAVGQVRHGRARAGVRGGRRPARGPRLRHGRHASSWIPASRCTCPRGCGNAYQTLTSDVVYSYLGERALVAGRAVHADPGVRSGAGHRLADRAGRGHPFREGHRAPAAGRTCDRHAARWAPPARSGGHWLPGCPRRRHPRSGRGRSRRRRDSADIDWSAFDTIVNAAAWTAVDAAESPDGRIGAWRANAAGPPRWPGSPPGTTPRWCTCPPSTSSTAPRPRPYAEDAPIAPLSAYGASKAAGDLAVRRCDRHLLVRPTWVVGDGHNFVRTMAGLAAPRHRAHGGRRPDRTPHVRRRRRGRDRAPAGRRRRAAPSTSPAAGRRRRGPTWRARSTRLAAPSSPSADTTTAAYFADKPAAAPRPLNSVLDLARPPRPASRSPTGATGSAAHVG